MDRSRLISSAIDELRQIRSDIRSTASLDTVRRSFERLQEIRRQHVDDFDLQIIIADVHDEIIDRARFLRNETEPAARSSSGARFSAAGPKLEGEFSSATSSSGRRSGSSATPPEPAVLEEPQGAEIPPEVPKLDRKSWQLAVGLSILFTVGIFASFFYLIQTARRLNFGADPVPTATGPQAVTPDKNGTPAAGKQVAAITTPAIPLTPTMRLYTDLIGGTATIDDQSPKDLVDGELSVEALAAGEHSVRVESRGGSAAFTFFLGNDKGAPQVTNILKSTNAMVVLVSVKDGSGRLTTDASGATLLLDDKATGTISPEGLLLTDLGDKDHSLELTRARDKQKFVLTYTPAPTLTVFVKSDPSTGVLTVSTGQDGVAIFINDLPYKRVTTHGEVRIPLKVGTYRIRVQKEGFQDAPVQTIEVKKSAEASVQFHLLPALSDFATLQIKGAQPGTVAYVDHQMAATVGVDGTAKIVNIKPGAHTIELHHDQAITKQLGRSFDAGQTLTLSGVDVALDHLAADNKSVIPGNPGPAIIPPPEVPQLQPEAAASAIGEQVHKGGGFIPYHTPKAAGQYYFQAHTKLGGMLRHGKLQWYAGYQDAANYVLFSLDGKHAEVKEVRGGKAVDIGRTSFSLASDEWVQIEMSVRADALQARAKSGSGDWIALTPVSATGRDFTKDSVGLYVPSNDEVAVANFRFSGH